MPKLHIRHKYTTLITQHIVINRSPHFSIHTPFDRFICSIYGGFQDFTLCITSTCCCTITTNIARPSMIIYNIMRIIRLSFIFLQAIINNPNNHMFITILNNPQLERIASIVRYNLIKNKMSPIPITPSTLYF